MTVGPVQFPGKGLVLLPNGMELRYAQPTSGDDGLKYRYGKSWHKIYGAKFLENIIQALARIVVMDAALRLNAKGYRFVLQAHDELVFIVPEYSIDEAKQIIHAEMTVSPTWAPDLPLTADIGVGSSYGEAK